MMKKHRGKNNKVREKKTQKDKAGTDGKDGK